MEESRAIRDDKVLFVQNLIPSCVPAMAAAIPLAMFRLGIVFIEKRR